jgi:ATP-dependent DNA helicase DinG
MPARGARSGDPPSGDAASFDAQAGDASAGDAVSGDAPSFDAPAGAALSGNGCPSLPSVADLLAAAVAGIGGTTRSGQDAMAEAVGHAIGSGEHLAVQAGTGTGKSLAYLVPAMAHAISRNSSVVVATATIALQRQLIDRDLPRLTPALAPLLGREPTYAILKGRRNYLCLHRRRTGPPDEPGETLFDPAAVSAVGGQVRRLTEWAADTATGDRDDLVPGVEERAWRQVSVSAGECLGAQRCPFGTQCFAERARDEAGRVDIVVTNHALLAIDALEEFGVLPEHDVVIIDEAHDLVNRVTSAASAELSAPAVEAAARRCGRVLTAEDAGPLRTAGEAAERVMADIAAGRLDDLPAPLATSLATVRDAAGACAAQVRASASESAQDAERLAAWRAALAALDDVGATAGRILAAFGPEIADRPDVVWMDRPPDAEARRPPMLRVAPLDVGALLAERLFRRQTIVLTSATLALGGSFEPLARQWGLPADGAASAHADSAASAPADSAASAPAGLAWSGLDVGSPFDHPRSGILYVASHLPQPGRDGLPAPYLTELRELIDAAGGRTLGLFSSMRAARQAAEELRAQVGQPLLCQGDDGTAELVRRFIEDETSCLFGTLSLWQGVDVPGRSLQLVVIDRIPFPRPDDPLASARQRAVAARGGNGFMAVAAAQAALLLAQGAGRLLRTMDDKGMVAVLDPRLVTARYSGFLRASQAPFWTTTDPGIARAALRRLAAQPG